jgi:hypothetical protein
MREPLVRVRVILQHEGSGHAAIPIAIIECGVPHDGEDDDQGMWRAEEWLENHDWHKGRDAAGFVLWTRQNRNLYTRLDDLFAVITEPLWVERAR